MKKLSHVSLITAVIVFAIAIILSCFKTNFIAGPNGWLDLSMALMVFSIAFKYVFASGGEG